MLLCTVYVYNKWLHLTATISERPSHSSPALVEGRTPVGQGHKGEWTCALAMKGQGYAMLEVHCQVPQSRYWGWGSRFQAGHWRFGGLMAPHPNVRSCAWINGICDCEVNCAQTQLLNLILAASNLLVSRNWRGNEYGWYGWEWASKRESQPASKRHCCQPQQWVGWPKWQVTSGNKPFECTHIAKHFMLHTILSVCRIFFKHNSSKAKSKDFKKCTFWRRFCLSISWPTALPGHTPSYTFFLSFFEHLFSQSLHFLKCIPHLIFPSLVIPSLHLSVRADQTGTFQVLLMEETAGH